MKTIINRFIKLYIIAVPALFVGCDKTGNSSETMIVEFINKYLADTDIGWLVIHDGDGDNILAVKKLNGNGVYDFGHLDAERVSFTFARSYYSGTRKYVYLYTYLNTEPGQWYYRGRNNYYRGKIYITLNDKPTGFNYRTISLPSLAYMGTVTGSSTGMTTNVNQLEKNEKISIFTSVINGAQDSAYGNWILDQSYDSSINNQFSFSLNNLLPSQNVTTSRPLTYSYMYAYRDEMYYGYYLYRSNYISPKTNHVVFTCPQFTSNLLNFCGGNISSAEGYYYYYFGNTIPSNLTISDASISADYDTSDVRFENIALNGNADLIEGSWGFSNSNSTYTWYVRSQTGKMSIKRPVLPDSVMNDLGITLEVFNSYSIGLFDYDAITGWDDYINTINMTSNYSIPYKTYYRYYFNIPLSVNKNPVMPEQFEDR